MAKVYIGVGHGGKDSGALGNGFKEKDLNLSVARACVSFLKTSGVTTKISRDCDMDKSINAKVAESNAFGADVCVDIHFNAGGGDGAEAFYSPQDGKEKKLADLVVKEFVNIGQNSRGAKPNIMHGSNDYFGMVRSPKATAILVECAFIDTKDILIADTEVKRVIIGKAIAKAICAFLGVKFSETTQSSPPSVMVQNITVGCKVKITGKNPVYGGLSSDKGKIIPASVCTTKHTVLELRKLDGVQQARLKEINSWVSLAYLTKV